MDAQTEVVGQALQCGLPPARAIAVAAAGIGGDVEGIRRGVRRPPHHRPPLADRRDREGGRVVVAPHADPRFVPRHVVDAVRNRLAHGVAGEIMHAHPLRGARGLPFAPGILEIPHQFLLLRVDGDHGLLALHERGGSRVDMLELRVAVRVRGAFAGLLQRVQPKAESVQQPPHRRRTHRPALRGQRACQLCLALARPPQGRHRIPARHRLDQDHQCFGEPRLDLLDAGSPGTRPTNAPRKRDALRQLPTPIADRLARQTCGRRHDCIAAVPQRRRFRRRPQPAPALIEQRGHHDELGHERRFEVCVALHRTGVRSHAQD